MLSSYIRPYLVESSVRVRAHRLELDLGSRIDYACIRYNDQLLTTFGDCTLKILRAQLDMQYETILVTKLGPFYFWTHGVFLVCHESVRFYGHPINWTSEFDASEESYKMTRDQYKDLLLVDHVGVMKTDHDIPGYNFTPIMMAFDRDLKTQLGRRRLTKVRWSSDTLQLKKPKKFCDINKVALDTLVFTRGLKSDYYAGEFEIEGYDLIVFSLENRLAWLDYIPGLWLRRKVMSTFGYNLDFSQRISEILVDVWFEIRWYSDFL